MFEYLGGAIHVNLFGLGNMALFIVLLNYIDRITNQ